MRRLLSDTAWSPDNEQLQYGGATFTLASSTMRQLWSAKSRWERYPAAVLDPHGMRAIVAVLSQLPVVSVSLTNSPAGRAIRAYLDERHRGIPVHRIAQGVLRLSPSLPEYLIGRHRQAVRTNTKRARALGIECRPVPVPERHDLLDRWLAQWQPQVAPHVSVEHYINAVPAHVEWWLASDRSRTPLALALLGVDDEWAMLRAMVSQSHPARWLLHTQIVGELCERDVGHLLVREANALLMSPELQYFQRLLGYRVVHLARPQRARDGHRG